MIPPDWDFEFLVSVTGLLHRERILRNAAGLYWAGRSFHHFSFILKHEIPALSMTLRFFSSALVKYTGNTTSFSHSVPFFYCKIPNKHKSVCTASLYKIGFM